MQTWQHERAADQAVDRSRLPRTKHIGTDREEDMEMEVVTSPHSEQGFF